MPLMGSTQLRRESDMSQGMVGLGTIVKILNMTHEAASLKMDLCEFKMYVINSEAITQFKKRYK